MRWTRWFRRAASPRAASPRAASLLLLALTLATYANALGNGFCFDDRPFIEKSREIHDIRNVPRILGLTGRPPSYRPVRQVSYALDLWLYGLHPFGFHLTNLLLHALCVLLVLAVARRLLGSPPAALAAAALFALHPIHTESVTYISGRKDVLCTLFLLAAYAVFLEIRRRHEGSRRARGALHALYFLLFALSAGSKEMAVGLLPLVLLTDALGLAGEPIPEPRKGAGLAARLRSTLARHPLFYAFQGVGLGAALYFYLVVRVGTHASWHGGSPLCNFLTAARIHLLYLGRMLVPWKLVGDYHYDAFPVTTRPLDPAGIAGMAVVALLTLFLVRAARRRPVLALGGLWYLGTLLPVSHIRPHHELLAERFLYLPSVGFCLAAGLLFHRLARGRWRRATIAALVVVLAAYGVRTHLRNRDWRDDLTFWRVTAAQVPRNSRAHVYLAYNLFYAGRRREAISEMKRGLEIEPDLYSAHYNLGRMYETSGDLPRAIEQYREELRRYRNRDAYFNLANLYGRIGRLDEAERLFLEMLDHFPRDAGARYYLAIIYRKTGRQKDAIRSLLDCLRLDPHHEAARRTLAELRP